MNEAVTPAEIAGLQWQDATPASTGLFWYCHPAAFELPVLVRLDRVGLELKAFFPDIPAPLPLRMLAGGRWAVPVTHPR